MNINDLVIESVDDILDLETINTWESMLPYIKRNIDMTEIDIEPVMANKYIGDFYGILQEHNVPTYLWYPVMRINGFTSTIEYTDDITSFKLPDASKLDELYKLI